MSQAALQFAISAAVIVVAGILLSRFADAIADRTGLGRLLVGSILLASATSMPELSVDVNAARMGSPDLAVGDLMGSSLMNLLILGLLDLMPSSRGRVLSRVSVAHALPATLSVALMALAALAITTRSGADLFGVGVGSLAIVLGYGYGVRLVYLDQRLGLPPHVGGLVVTSEETGGRVPSLRFAIGGFGLSAGAIVLAAPYLASAAGVLAEQTGLGGTFVGTTLVALATSLPELVASLTALRMGAPDLALGNVFGSNVFNMVLLVPIDLAYPGSLFAAISAAHVVTALATIVVTAVVVMGQLYQAERRVRLIEPDGVLIIGLVVASLVMVYLMK